MRIDMRVGYKSAIVNTNTLAILTCFALVSSALVADDSLKSLGISATEPASGPAVKVADGYMVPYTLRVPGSSVEFDMIPIPGGVLSVGSPENEEGHKSDEGPQFKVEVGPMWVAKCEATWAEYRLYMSMYGLFKQLQMKGIGNVNADSKVDAVTAPTELYEPSFTFEFGDDPRLPAVTMTQFAAKQYTKWLSKLTGHQYRLPTEAEWEYACRAGSTTAFSFGNDASAVDTYAWHAGNSDGKPQRVGQKKANAFGLHDMHGNVMEWTINGYSADGYSFARESKQPLSVMASVTWPDSPENRVVRGGSFQDEATLLRSAAKVASQDEEWKSEDPNIPLSPWWYTSDPARGVGLRVFRSYQPLDPKDIQKFWEIDHEFIEQDVQARLDEGRGVLSNVDPGLSKEIARIKQQ
jgi:formylglycine-generating enzyme